MREKILKTGKFGKRRLGASVIALAVVAVMVFTLIPTEAFAKTADLDTSTKYTESLGDNASTEYAGRVWTDKSVYDEKATFETYGGGSVTVNVNENGVTDEEFLVAYSALATSESVQGQQQAPVDVVLILDISGSMSNQDSNMDNGKSRIYNAVQAANDAIDDLMALNPYTRVSVVAFSDNAQVLLPLDRYTKNKTVEREWIQTGPFGQGYWQETEVEVPYFTLNRDSASENYAVLYTNAVGSNGTITDSTDVQGGTNIQMGLYEGMNVLAAEDSTTVEINGSVVQRVPSVILLSDGSPTYSSNDSEWWAPADNYNDGPGSAPYAGNGMKAILVGSYMKDAIDRNYDVAGTALSTTVYTVGMGITGLSDNEKNLAYMTLDPGTYWNDDDVTNNMKTTIKNYWSQYTRNNNTGTLNINVGTLAQDGRDWVYRDKNYFLQHPDTGYDVNPATGYDYVDDYHDADNASAVTDVFDQIVANISITAPQVPTELKGVDPITDGYITYTDPVGQYMEVKDVKSIIYAGTEFADKTVTTAGDVTTYTFSGTVDSPVYGHQEIKNIIITVEKAQDGSETLVIKIPASVIPLRVNEVTLNADGTVKTHTNNGAYPARVVYSVGLQDGVKKVDDNGNEYIDTTMLSADYLAANTNEDGSVNFYSNLFTNSKTVNGRTVGDATVEFEAAHTNPFYYILDDMPIYKDKEFKEQVTAAEGIDDDTIYYYEDVYYHGSAVEVDAVERTGAQLKQTEIKTGTDGYLYRAAGSPRLNRMLEFEGTKVKNATGTAEDFYAPTFQHAEGSTDPYDGKIVVYLGNNGVFSLPAGGNLQISKDVNAAAGLTAPDKEFTFTLDLDGTDVNQGEYKYVIVDSNNEQVSAGTVSKDNNTITLKDGQTATVYSLPPGTTYTVTESDVAGFTAESTGSTGTITAGATSTAAFTNTYNVTNVEFPTDGTLAGQKELTGREWTDNDTFTFFITPYNNAPLPAGYDAEKGVTVSGPDENGGQTAAFDFGTIEFNAPGVYRYTIVEKEPENTEYLPGMTYSRALYRLVVTVEDNGDGTLKVASSDLQKLYDDAANALFTYDEDGQIVMNEGEAGQDTIKFVNSYSAESVIRVPVAKKAYTDNSGMNPLVSGMFQFKLEAVGYIVDDGALVKDTSKVPMPEGSVDGAITTENEGGNVTFPSVEFTEEDIPSGAQKITFRYQMNEVAPTDKVNGMTYDDEVYTIDVVVSIDPTSAILDVKAIYPNDERIVTFVNEYTPVPVTADIEGNKTLNGRDMKDGETFEFNVAGADAATNLAVRNGDIVVPTSTATVSGGADGKAVGFTFEDIQFKKAGTYNFEVTEAAGTAPAVDYDDAAVSVTVVVDDADKDGNLEITSITYSNGKEAAEFTNTYTTEFEGTPISLDGTKNLTGKTLLEGEFFFNVIEYFNGEKVSEGMVSHTADTTADANGVYTGTISFLKDKTYSEAGTYEYIITEQIPDPKVGGTTYDESEYRYTVVVEDVDQIGELTVTSTKLEIADGDSWKAADAVVFNNKYEPEPTIADVPVTKKVIAGDRSAALKAGDFSFKLTAVSAEPADGVILPGETTATNAADGSISFEKITFTKAGTYTFKITEIVPDDKDKIPGITYTTEDIMLTYRVVDDRNGNLTAHLIASSGSETFVNLYNAEPADVDIEISKTFTGRENDAWLSTDKFDFEIGILDPATQDALEDGVIEFPTDAATGLIETKTIDAKGETITGNIKVNKAGTYKFIVREKTDDPIPGITYDSEPREVTIVATDNSETAKLDVTVTVKKGDTDVTVVENNVYKLNFTNRYDTESTDISGHDDLVITKNFTGREDDKWLDTDKFVFELAAYDDVTAQAIEDEVVEMPASTELTVSNANKTRAHFGNITFHKTGTYKFVVTEKASGILGVTDDQDKDRVIIVNVKDDNVGGLVATIADHSEDLVFNNTYSTEEVTLDGATNLKITKSLSGRDWFKGDDFTFKIDPFGTVTENAIEAGNVVMPASTEITIKAGSDLTDANVEGAFGDITFKAKGSYRFVITEVEGGIDNLTYDKHTCYVTVVVTDNGEGKLVAAPSYEGSAVFVNKYTADSVKAVLEGTKVLKGRTLAADEFGFEIEAVTKDAPMPAATNVSNTAEGKVAFGAITYTEAGTYEYVITEKAGDLNGIDYDDGKVYATVTVTYNSATGKLTPDVSYEKAGGNEGNGFTFTNIYTPEKTEPVVIGAQKTVTPSEGNSFNMAGGDFSFEIKAAAGNPDSDPVESALKENTADGAVALFNAQYTEPGTYVYTVNEVEGTHAGIVYDDAVYTVKVTVTEDTAAAKLFADVKIFKDDKEVSAITFDNKYDPAKASIIIHGHKDLTGGHKDLEEGEFTFQLKDADGNVIMDAKNHGSGAFQFETITYDKAGEYVYTVSEVKGDKTGYTYDPKEYTVKVNVTDENGQLKAEFAEGYGDKDAAGEPVIVFSNSYVPEPVSVVIGDEVGNEFTKNLDGREINEGEFEFAVLDETGAVIKTAANDAKGHFAFELKFDKAGRYNYTIVEQKVDSLGGMTFDTETSYAVIVTVEDKDGKLAVTELNYVGKDNAAIEAGDVVFNNTYKAEPASINLKAVKQLKGRDIESGEFEFTIEAVIEGTPMPEHASVKNDASGVVDFGTITYDKAGEYEYIIYEVKGDAEGITYDDTVHKVIVTVKDDLNGHLVPTVNCGDDGIIFTNIYTDPTDPGDEPTVPGTPSEPTSEAPADEVSDGGTQTGDDFNMMIYLILVLAAAAVAGGAVVTRRKVD